MEWDFHDYRLSGVFGEVSSELGAQVARFWLSNGAIPDEAACLARAKELVVVARNSSGAIAGVSTVYIVPDPHRPGQTAYAYRTFIQPRDRVVGLFVAIFNASRELLKDVRASGGAGLDSKRPDHIIFVLENRKFEGAAAKRIFHRIDCSYAGRDPRGLEIWEAALT